MESKARWLTDKYILLMLLCFPLWTGFEGYARLTLSKYVFFAAATGGWLLALFILAWADRTLFRRPRPAQFCALFFMAACCLSAALSPFGGDVILGAGRYDGLVTLLLYGGIFLGVSAYGRMRKLYVYALALSASLCCVVALFQLRGGNPLGLFPGDLRYYDSGVRYSGAFLGMIGNVDVLAAFFALCLPLFIAAPCLSGEKRDLLLLLPAALCLYVLFRSGVSSGAAALLGGALICGPYLGFVKRGRRAGLILSALSLCVLIAGLAVVYLWPGDSGTVWELSRVLHGDLRDSFGSSRVLIWRDCLALVRERPLLGGGPDTLTLRTELGFSRYVAETGQTLSNHVDNAHNEYLNYLVNVGALGLLAYLSVVCASLTAAIRRGKRAGLVPAAACGAVCYLIQSFFGLGLCIVVPILWIYLGLSCSGDTEETDERNDR